MMKREFTNERPDKVAITITEDKSTESADSVFIEIDNATTKTKSSLTLTYAEAGMLYMMLDSYLTPMPQVALISGYVPLYDQTKDVAPEEYRSSMRDVYVVAPTAHHVKFPFIDALTACHELRRYKFTNLCDLFKTPEEVEYLDKVFTARLAAGVDIRDMFYPQTAKDGEFDPKPPHTAKDCRYLLSKQTVTPITLKMLYDHDIPIPFNVVMIPQLDGMDRLARCRMDMYDCHLLPRWKQL